MGRSSAAALAVLVLGATPAAAQRAGSLLVPDANRPVVTLGEAIRLAEKVQPAVVQAYTQMRNAEAQKKGAVGQWLPNVNANSSVGTLFSENARPDPITGVPVTAGSSLNSVNVGANASLLLFTGFQRGANVRAANAGIRAAESGVVNAQFQQRLATTNQFLAALAADQLVRVREASVTRAQEQLNQSQNRFRAGAATRSDTLRAFVGVRTAEADLASAFATLAAAEATLAQLVGAEGRVRAQDDSAYYRAPADLDPDALVREALSASPQVRVQEENVRAAAANVTAARSTYWPTVTLNANSSWNGNSRLNNYQLFNQRQATVALTWPLFNRFQREQQIAVSRAQVTLAEAQAADARRLVAATALAQLAAADAARQRLGLAQVSVEAATEDLRVQGERYRVGAATILDVLTSQEALTQAEVNVVTARFDFLRAKAQVEALIGRSL